MKLLLSGLTIASTLAAAVGAMDQSPATADGVAAEGGAGRPPAPRGLAVTAVTHSAMNVTWEPPATDTPDSPIHYRVYYRAHNVPLVEMEEVGVPSLQLTGLTNNTAYDVFATSMFEGRESELSEILRVTTTGYQRSVPIIQGPTVEPDELTEGEAMTVTCIARGTPLPSVQLYIAGRQRSQEVYHQLVTTVDNVKRHMEVVTCVADNGEGAIVHSSRHVTIRRRPLVTEERPDLVSSEGGAVILRCYVDAYPSPTLSWRAPNGQPINDSSFNVTEEHVKEGKYIMELAIERVAAKHFGTYSCGAENNLGSKWKEILLKKRPHPPRLFQLGVSECCRQLNISTSCGGACRDNPAERRAALAAPGCLQELSKLMACAADGSDHSDCCVARSLPVHCLSWCEGRHTADHVPSCVPRHAIDIIGCFHEGKELIPSPPRNIRVEMVNSSEAVVTWDPPARNGDKVVIYRLSWRQLNASGSAHLDTRRTHHRLSGLVPSSGYRLTLAAANWHGSSVRTSVEFSSADGWTAARGSHAAGLGSGAALALGLALATLALLALALGAAWLVRRRRQKDVSRFNISFSNPTFLKQAGGPSGHREPPSAAVTQ